MKFFVCILFLLAPIQAFAHAEEPAVRAVFEKDDGILIQANFGILPEDSTRYVCEEAFLGGDTWKVAVLGDQEWVTYGSNNIKRTEDGCSFETVKDIDSIVGDIRVSPNKGTIAYYANSGSEPGIWTSKDRGKSFQRIDYDVEGLQITGMRFANNATLLVSAYDTNQEGKGLLISIALPSFQTTLVDLPEGVTFPYLFDANEHGIVWLGRLEKQTIFIGTLADSDELRYEPEVWPVGALLSKDGQKIYVGGVLEGSGIAVGDRSSGEFKTILADHILDCINRVGEKIYTCGLERRDGFDLFELENEKLKGVSKFTNIEGPKTQCPEDSTVSVVCPIVWAESASYFGKDPDAGVVEPDMGISEDMGNTTPEPTPEDTGCSTSSSNSFSLFLLLGLIFLGRRLK